MGITCRHLMSPRVLLALCCCVGWGFMLLYVTNTVQEIGRALNTKRNVGPVDKNLKSVGYEQHEGWHSWKQTSQEYNYDGVFASQTDCPCRWEDDCSSGVNGSTYSWKGIVHSSTIKNISTAIDYADAYLCREEDGFRRVALETIYELKFLISCALCNLKTYFGSSLVKKNIMTAGTVHVTEEGMTAEEVLRGHYGTWSTWDDEVVNASVPGHVVLLDPNTGTPISGSPFVPIGSYSIFLVGNEEQLCDEDTFYTWGLMTYSAEGDGSLENVVGYVVCERLNYEVVTDTTDTTLETSTDATSAMTNTPIETTKDTSDETTLTDIDTTPETTSAVTDTSTETSADTTTTVTDTSTETSSDTTTTATDTTTETSSDTTTTATDTTTETSSDTTTTATDTTTETSSDTSTESTSATYNTTSTPTTPPGITTTTFPDTTTISTTTTATSPNTTTISSTTTTTTTTTASITTTTTTTTISSKPGECCVLQYRGDLLCPGNTLWIDCRAGYSGSKGMECINGEVVVVMDLCIADWIHDVDSMINTGNESAADIAEIVKNETETETPINQAELSYLVTLVTNMTYLLEKQIEGAEGNNSMKQEMANQYITELVKIEGNLFTYEETWDSLDEVSSGKLGTSLLHDLEKTGFILAQYVENEQRNFTDPTLNMTVISKPREELAGQELYVPGQVSDTFIHLPVDFEELLPPGEPQACLVGYFLDQNSASRALPLGLSKLYSIDEPKEMNSLAVSMTLGGLNNSVNFTSMDSRVIIRLHHTYRETGPFYSNLYRNRREDEVPSRIPGTAKCVYWDPVDSGWVTNGCELINTTREDTFCSCSHLSMFSVITNVHKYMGRDPVLDILSTILLSISCLGLLLTFSILQFCRGVQAGPRNSITKQLSVSLLISHLIIILFLDPDFLKIKEEACKAVAVILHYVLLASIFWMLAEGLHLFQKSVFFFDQTNYMIAYWMIGYGIPVVVVLVTATTALETQQWADESYAPEDSEYCWLNTEKGYIWAFTGPLVLVIVANTFFMVLAIHSAAKRTVNKKKTASQKFLLWIKGSLSLNCILGVTWVFGLLYVSANHFFAYVFTIFNASQGVMIFAFNCMLNENVRTAFITSLPEAVKSCHTEKAAGSEETANRRASKGVARGTSRASLDFNRADTADHHHHLYDRGRSVLDLADRERSKHRIFSAANIGISLSTRMRWDRALRELTEQQNQSCPPLSGQFNSVCKCEVPHPPRRVSLGDLRMGPVPARVSPISKSLCHRKDTEWSSVTQFSFIADGEKSWRDSVDFFDLDGSNSSSSSSSSPSTSRPSAHNLSLEKTEGPPHSH